MEWETTMDDTPREHADPPPPAAWDGVGPPKVLRPTRMQFTDQMRETVRKTVEAFNEFGRSLAEFARSEEFRMLFRHSRTETARTVRNETMRAFYAVRGRPKRNGLRLRSTHPRRYWGPRNHYSPYFYFQGCGCDLLGVLPTELTLTIEGATPDPCGITGGPTEPCGLCGEPIGIGKAFYQDEDGFFVTSEADAAEDSDFPICLKCVNAQAEWQESTPSRIDE